MLRTIVIALVAVLLSLAPAGAASLSMPGCPTSNAAMVGMAAHERVQHDCDAAKQTRASHCAHAGLCAASVCTALAGVMDDLRLVRQDRSRLLTLPSDLRLAGHTIRPPLEPPRLGA